MEGQSATLPDPTDGSHFKLARHDSGIVSQKSLLHANSGALRSQKSLLHANSGSLKRKGTSGGLIRWESRGKWWQNEGKQSKSAGAELQKGIAVACTNAWLAISYWLKTVYMVSRRHPSVLILPLLLGVACLAGGLMAVELAARNEAHQAHDDAVAAGSQAVASLQLRVTGQALQAAATLASLVGERPGMSVLAPLLPLVGLRLVQQAPVGSITQVLLAPFGLVAASYEPTPQAGAQGSADISSSGGSSSSTGSSSIGTLGWSLVETAAVRGDILRAVRGQVPVLSVGVSTGNGGDLTVTGFHPVYIPGVAANETWGNAPTSGSGDLPALADPNAADCGGACYDARTRSKLWGFASAAVSLTSLLRGPSTDLSSLTGLGYRYRLTVRPSGGTGAEVVAAESSPPPSSNADGRHAVRLPVHLSVAAAAASTTAAAAGGAPAAAAPAADGELLVYRSEGWQPNWEPALLATVVVTSLALMFLLLAVLVAYWRHKVMLQTMLPVKVIRVLGTGQRYYQHFESVSVLYADVVRYIAMPKDGVEGSELPSLEVVKLLNAVHSMYDGIMEKYGLVKIQRSGESFLAVGGCPSPDDPVAVAVRVASCARDMVLATSRFRGVGGFRVQLRVGLHSGPTVAAVVGTKMPRFSLFGDVVDVAYYMEATSTAMAVHVSQATVALLTVANDPLLQLKPRGRMDIHGEGAMSTAWLRFDTLPDPAVEADTAARANAASNVTFPGGGNGGGGGGGGGAKGKKQPPLPPPPAVIVIGENAKGSAPQPQQPLRKQQVGGGGDARAVASGTNGGGGEDGARGTAKGADGPTDPPSNATTTAATAPPTRATRAALLEGDSDYPVPVRLAEEEYGTNGQMGGAGAGAKRQSGELASALSVGTGTSLYAATEPSNSSEVAHAVPSLKPSANATAAGAGAPSN